MESVEPQSAAPTLMHAGFNPRHIYETIMGGVGGGDANGETVNNQGLTNIDGQLTNEAAAAATSAAGGGGGNPAAGGGNQARPQQQRSKVKKEKNADPTNTKWLFETALKNISKTDANGVTPKTPVSILQELLSRRGITPAYELVQIEGAIHEPTFRYRVSFNEKDVPFTAMGAGRSKKEAKHAAARALIDKLTGVNVSPSQGDGNAAAASAGAATTSSGAENASAVGPEDKVQGNPIGWLQEACMSRRWPPPTYETETEVGLPHERLFTIACTILNYREVGKGKSKKIAKRLAAHNMWNRLNENPLQADEINDALHNDSESEKLNYYGDLKDSNVATVTGQLSSKVSQFHKQLKNATGEKILKLQKTCFGPKTDFQKILAEISAENKFEVTYVEIEEKSFNKKFQCLLQLSTLPIGVCHGSGDTMEEAKMMAAMNALEYIKIMTKK